MVHLSTLLFAGATLCAGVAAFENKVFLIRHGEKPDNDGQGLSPEGEERAECLPSVFGSSSAFNIGYILAEQPQDDGDRTRPLETVTPLAESLGLTVDTSCDRDDQDCVGDAVKAFASESSKNILICWEHKVLTDILDDLGVDNPPDYPDDSFDIIWTMKDKTLVSQTSENCPGLDD